ncbi:MAG: ribonuclease III [Clostridiales bacterium]|nr:ribonuclease III [Clostridiales bacterium]
MLDRKFIRNIEKAIGYSFYDKELLMKAITHSSHDQNHNYEKLEFLGDSVLQIIISNFLFDKHHYLSEGEMTVTRAYAVCGETLGKAGSDMQLDKYIFIGSSGKKKKINKNKSVLADVFESLTAAIYLDSGLEEAEKFVLTKLSCYVNEYTNSGDNKDYKTKLQHITQDLFSLEPQYELRSEKGPAHDRTFSIDVYVKGNHCGKGKGKSKKKAQQDAAMNALKRYDRKSSF